VPPQEPYFRPYFWSKKPPLEPVFLTVEPKPIYLLKEGLEYSPAKKNFLLQKRASYLIAFERQTERTRLLREKKFRILLARYDTQRREWQRRQVLRKEDFDKKYKKYLLLQLAYKKRLERYKPYKLRFRKIFGRILHENPYYKDLIRAPYGLILLNERMSGNISVSTTSPRYGSGFWRNFDSSLTPVPTGVLDGSTITESLRSVDIALGPLRAEIEAKLSQKFYEKLVRRKVHLGNLIAERAQATSLLISSVKAVLSVISGKKRLLKSLSSLNAYSLIHGKKIAVDSANALLAFKFGVEPLIADVRGAAEQFASYTVDPTSLTITIRTNTTRDVNLKDVDSFSEISGKMTVSYCCTYGFEDNLDVARLLNSLGLFNPAEIAWEMTPWSFVVDWFLPIGSFISQTTADTGLLFVKGTRTEKLVLDILPSSATAGLNLSSELASSATSGTSCVLTHYGPYTYADGSTQKSLYCSYSSVRLVGERYQRSVTRRTLLSEPPHKFLIAVPPPSLSLSHSLESLALLVQKVLK